MSCKKVNRKVTLGTLQAKIGFGLITCGFVTKNLDAVSIHSYVMYWGSACFIIAGVLTAATVEFRESCLAKFAMIMNLISAAAAAVAAVLFFIDMKHLSIDPPQCDDPSSPECEMILHHGIFIMGLKPLLAVSLLEVCMSFGAIVLICADTSSSEAAS